MKHLAALALVLWTVTTVSGAQERTLERWQDDVEAMHEYRPGYPFWQHIFLITDGWIAFGSAQDGRLLVSFPAKGDWTRDGVWSDASLATILDGETLPRNLDDRRARVAALLEARVGRVLHNPTRGQFLLPNARRYGAFLGEWAAIYDRFGVPGEVGLAQALIESGLNGTRRSEARAIGFCQFLLKNWRHLDRLSPDVLEGFNQTTQAPYCAAYLSILATKYGTFIPALSEHHSGGANVGRILLNGEWLGGDDGREQYFRGAELARGLRQIDLYGYRDLYRTYGPRSYLYAEMVFGNTFNVRNLTETTPQEKIYAMRTSRAYTLAEVVKRTKLTADQVRRFNPALTRRIPAGATLYLPRYMKEFGADVSFWHRPATAAYADTLKDFLALDASPEKWDSRAFEPVLRGFQRRFRETRSEEGNVMATTLAYVMDEAYTSGRVEILAEFRSKEAVRQLFEQGRQVRDAARPQADTDAAKADD